MNLLSDSSIYKNGGEPMGPIRVVHYLDQCVMEAQSKCLPSSTISVTWRLHIAVDAALRVPGFPTTERLNVLMKGTATLALSIGLLQGSLFLEIVSS